MAHYSFTVTSTKGTIIIATSAAALGQQLPSLSNCTYIGIVPIQILNIIKLKISMIRNCNITVMLQYEVVRL